MLPALLADAVLAAAAAALTDALRAAYQIIRIAIADAIACTPGTDPDRASFTIAVETARDQVIQAANIIAATVIDLAGSFRHCQLVLAGQGRVLSPPAGRIPDEFS